MSPLGRIDRRLWLLLLTAGVASLAWLGLTFGLLSAALDVGEGEHVLHLLGGRLAWIGFAWLFGIALIAYGLKRWFDHWVTPLVRLAEEAKIVLRTDVVKQLPPAGNHETRVLADIFNQLVEQRETLRQEMDAKVKAAAQSILEEKSRLAAVMAELTQSVVVCNNDGRILLYNQSARRQFQQWQSAASKGAGLLGLGRSIHALFDQKLVVHALAQVRRRCQRGDANPSSQFVTVAPAGQLLKVLVAPVRLSSGTEPQGPAAQTMTGFVLMLDDVMADYEQEAERDRILQGLSEGSRASLANIQAAVEMLDYPDLEAEMRERFLRVVRDEVLTMGSRIQPLVNEASERLVRRWPMEEMLGADFVTAATIHIEDQCALAVQHVDVAPSVWLRVESFSLLQSLVYLADRLKDEFGIRFVQLRLKPAAQGQSKAQLDLIWIGQAISTETVMGWELDPIRTGGEVQSMSVRDVIERHGAALWFERERTSHQSYFRFLLPCANPHKEDVPEDPQAQGRPEYYDFDLFRLSPQASALEDMPLKDLAYTVFDTETTGLNPQGGDEIIQIGAVRILNGRMLRHETFEQLVNPECMIPAAGIPIHGITQEMVRGQPLIGEVLPRFHAFARETVLVGHNAAFDMRFLQLKEASTGVVFNQPVLDTLLLSALVHPSQASHRLEAIAQRFNVEIKGRHNAMGDALVTAELFLKLLPLLEAMGVRTLGQALAAAQQTYYARLKY